VDVRQPCHVARVACQHARRRRRARAQVPRVDDAVVGAAVERRRRRRQHERRHKRARVRVPVGARLRDRRAHRRLRSRRMEHNDAAAVRRRAAARERAARGVQADERLDEPRRGAARRGARPRRRRREAVAVRQQALDVEAVHADALARRGLVLARANRQQQPQVGLQHQARGDELDRLGVHQLQGREGAGAGEVVSAGSGVSRRPRPGGAARSSCKRQQAGAPSQPVARPPRPPGPRAP
jgi:hypothetical protein